MQIYRRKLRRDTVRRDVCGVQGRSKIIDRKEGKLAIGHKVEEEEHVGIYGRSREEIRMKTYSDDPLYYATTLKLRFRVGDLDLPERRKWYATSRDQEDRAQMCPCGETVESRTHIVENVKYARKNGP